MKSVNWQNGQRIIKQVLDWFSSSTDQNAQEYRQDMTQAGIIADALNELDIIVGANNTPATPSITVRTGVAYDVNGERIYVPDETLSYDATNPSDTTDDGRGVFLPTPHSTGSKNIPLTVNSLNFVWIDYLQVIDESLFTLQTATNAKQFYKKDNGYIITVTTVNTPPTAASLYLGSVNLTGFGVVSGSTIDTSGREFSLIEEHRVKIKTPLSDLSDATATYGYNQEATLDDHIKAVGSGPVTPQNPHGISLGDIGVDVEAVVENHQKFMHNNGMIGSKTTLISSLYPEHNPITPGDDYIVIKKLLPTEVVNVDGTTITSSDIPSDTPFIFGSLSDISGTYYIYLDKFTKSLVRTTTDPSSDVTKYPIVSMVWTAGVPALYDGDLTSITDLRVFGTINNDKIDNDDEYDMVALRVEDGSVSAPSLSWQSDANTGIYRSGSGIISFTSNGVLSANISGGQVSAVDGLVGSPAYSFLSDPTTGMYRSGSGVMSFSSNGVLSANISGGQISAVNGTASLPSYAFLLDPNTGLYSESADILAISTGGSKRVSINSTSLSIVSTSNQLVLGTTNTTTVSATAPSSSRVYTIPDAGADANVALTDGAQLFIGNPNSFRYFRATPQIGGDANAHIVMQMDSDPSHIWDLKTQAGPPYSLTWSNWAHARTLTLTADCLLTIGETITLNNGTGTATISKTPAQSGSRTFTIPDVSSSNFVMTEGSQTINGGKTFGNSMILSSGANLTLAATSNQLVLGTTNTYTITAPTPSASRIYTIPDVGTDATFIMSSGVGQTLFAAANTPGSPAISFVGDTNTGIYNIGADNVGISTGGVNRVNINNTTTDFSGQVRATHVSSAQVAYQFVGQPAGTGISNFSGSTYISYLGAEKLRVDNGVVTFCPITAGGAFSGYGTYAFLNPHNTTKIENSTFNSADHLSIYVDGSRWMYFDAENGQTTLEQAGLFVDFNSVSGSAAEFTLALGNDNTMTDGVSYKQLSLRTGAGSSAHTSGQSTTGVSTVATTIKSSVQSAFTMVTGDSGGTRFMDLLLVGAGGNALINVISQISVTGAPAGRAYSLLGSSLRLAMGSGTYDINVIQYGLSFR